MGAASETVEVTAEAPLLQTDTSAMSQEIDRSAGSGIAAQRPQCDEPNCSRSGRRARGLNCGRTGLNQGTRTGNQGWGNYQIGGAIQGQSAEYVDGSPINVLGGNTVALVMTQDAVQEFSVVTSDAGADFGRFAGGVVNMTSRSGTERMARIGV